MYHGYALSYLVSDLIVIHQQPVSVALSCSCVRAYFRRSLRPATRHLDEKQNVLTDKAIAF